MTYVVAGILLFVAAAVFLAAELFVPSHGLLGIFSGLFAVAGVVAMFMASPAWGAVSSFSLLIIAPLTLHYAIKYYPNSPVGKRVILQAPTAAMAAVHAEQMQKLQALIGKRGIAASDLRPAGTIEIEGQRLDCVSDSAIITSGTPIEVIGVTGMKVVVRAVA